MEVGGARGMGWGAGARHGGVDGGVEGGSNEALRQDRREKCAGQCFGKDFKNSLQSLHERNKKPDRRKIEGPRVVWAVFFWLTFCA